MSATSTETRAALNQFFIEAQAKALRQVEIAVGSRDEALDIVQESMLKLASKYSDQSNSWPQLFQRILQNAIRDWYRRKKVRRFFSWNTVGDEVTDGEQTTLATDVTVDSRSPEMHSQRQQNIGAVEHALKRLPHRQQQAFLLRAWWGHDIEETAFAMGCSPGSVKTHYSRALGKLRELLGEK